VTAVRGNNDRAVWAADIPETNVLEIGGAIVYVLHDLALLDLDPAAAGFQVVVSGHSHRPACERRDGVWYVNPGSAGPRRFTLPVATALLEIEHGEVRPRLIELSI
jgi:hypothetical protein